MKKYFVIIWNESVKIACTYNTADSAETAALMAEFAFCCRYPHIRFTRSSAEPVEG